MELDFIRSPYSSDSYFAEQHYKGGLHAVNWCNERNPQWGIEISFSTSLDFHGAG